MIYPEIRLTPRQRELVRCLCADMADAEIAAKLGIKLKTVQHEIYDLKRKLGITSGGIRGAYWRALTGAKVASSNV